MWVVVGGGGAFAFEGGGALVGLRSGGCGGGCDGPGLVGKERGWEADQAGWGCGGWVDGIHLVVAVEVCVGVRDGVSGRLVEA